MAQAIFPVGRRGEVRQRDRERPRTPTRGVGIGCQLGGARNTSYFDKGVRPSASPGLKAANPEDVARLSPDTTYWHEHVAGRAAVYFLRGRLRFGDGELAAPFPSALAGLGRQTRHADVPRCGVARGVASRLTRPERWIRPLEVLVQARDRPLRPRGHPPPRQPPTAPSPIRCQLRGQTLSEVDDLGIRLADDSRNEYRYNESSSEGPLVLPRVAAKGKRVGIRRRPWQYFKQPEPSLQRGRGRLDATPTGDPVLPGTPRSSLLGGPSASRSGLRIRSDCPATASTRSS